MSERRIGVIVGSLRRGYSDKLANALAALAPPSMRLERLGIGDLPLYNEDLETANPPAPWTAFRERTGVPVVIDGAASVERLEDDPRRLTGDIPVALSFHATKSFATGEGGAVVTTDPAVGRAVVETLNFGFFDRRESRVPSINGKMSEYHAAVGLAELDDWPAKRRAFGDVADRYRDRFAASGLAGAALLFAALGDETRLALLRHLAGGSSVSISVLAENFEVSRQAVTKHLQHLAAAGMIDGRREGREHLWTINSSRLSEAQQCLELIAAGWDDTLQRLKAHVEDRESAG